MQTGRRGFAAEAPLVLGCARRPGAQPPATELRSLTARSGFEWQRALAFAVGHDVAPLFGRGVDEARLDLPATIAEELTGIERATSFRNVQLSQLLVDLLRILGDGGVRAVAFKGPALASLLYGNVGMRTSADVDLLLVHDDLPAATALLEAAGWRRRDDRTGVRRGERSVPLYDDELDVDIDLETDLGSMRCYTRPVDPELLDRAVSVDVAGRPAPSLAPDALQEAIALRAGRYRWRSWKWVCDVADLLRAADEIDWDRLEHDVQAIDHVRTVDVGLLLAREHLGALLPASVDARIDRDRVVAGMARQVARANAGQVPMSAGAAHRFRLACRRRLGPKAHYLAHVVRHAGRLAD